MNLRDQRIEEIYQRYGDDLRKEKNTKKSKWDKNLKILQQTKLDDIDENKLLKKLGLKEERERLKTSQLGASFINYYMRVVQQIYPTI